MHVSPLNWEKESNMLKNTYPRVIIIAIFSLLLNQSPAIAAGRASDTVNTILSGAGIPSASTGINGDFYIDTKSMSFYGPKKNNRWPIPTSLRGPAGPIGPSGIDGKTGASGSTSDGKVGATGATGLKGETGATGPAGPKGDTGATGAAGPAGIKGDTGATGAAGPAGVKGETGAKGDAGSGGATAVLVGNLNFANLINGIAGSSTVSTGFGNFSATKSYLVDVLIYATNLSMPPFSLKVNFTSSSGASIISTKYIVTDGSSYRSSSSTYEYSIYAKVIVNGSAETSNFNLIATVTCGESTGSPSTKLTVSGDYVAQEIGTIN
jgi:hypothetical protein